MGTVRKAVVPAAGLGTRFLPVTRTVPKVMLPVLDTPALHYVINEAVASGVEQIALVVSPGQDPIGDYFGRIPALEEALERRGDADLLEQMRWMPDMADVTTLVQDEQLGLGHAVLMARDFVGREPFAVLLPDDLFWADRPALANLIEVFERYRASAMAVEEVEDEQVPFLGIVDPEPVDEGLFKVRGLVEKPRLEDAPSNLAIVGRYVLTPEVFDALGETEPGAIGEVQLTDAIASLLPMQPVYARRVRGVHIDAGTPVGLLRASVHEALQRADVSEAVRALLRKELEESG